MNDAQLLCRGTVRRRDGMAEVALEPKRCAGCDGRCGIRLGKARLPFEGLDLADGTPVEIVASARVLGAQALLVFGVPVALAVGAVLLAEQLEWGPWLAPVVLLASALAAMSMRRARSGGVASEPDIGRSGAGTIRIRLR